MRTTRTKGIVWGALLSLVAACAAEGGNGVTGGPGPSGQGDTVADAGATADTLAPVDTAVAADTTDTALADTAPDAGCSNTCPSEGATQCALGGVSTCTVVDGCLAWSATVTCDAGMVCIDGACVAACPNQACTVAGAHKCSEDGAAILECADHDGDACLDWGGAAPCDEGLVCSQGFCELSCKDECSVAGARKCEGDDVVTCQDHDGDACLEWGGPQPCEGLACSGGFCTSECKDDCTVAGAKKCDGNGVTVCSDANGDGCLEWGTVVACEAGKTCSGGFCASDCKDECEAAGQKKCELDQVVVCGAYDEDPCLDWGSPVPCEGDLVCSGGSCTTSCEDGCAVAGTKQCQGNGVATCGDYNSDGCLEWGTVEYCEGAQACQSGFCTETCVDACTVAGATKCSSDTVLTCGDSDDDSCLDWGAKSPCAAGLVCTGGHCAAQCEDDCTVKGAKKCVGNGLVVCGDEDADGCLEWSAPAACAAGLVCSAGSCATDCKDECTVSGAKKCEASGVAVCGQYDPDSCLEWSEPVQCDPGLVCSAGNCQTECADECTVAGAKACDPGGVTLCSDTNDDGCLEWGTPVACEAPLVCSQGNCAQTCTSECDVVGEKQCAPGGGSQVRTCGDSNGDGCLEWGSPVACAQGLVCADGSCVNECQDACTTVGTKQCQGNGFAACGDTNGDGCLEWGTVVYCAEGQSCQDGFCTSTCVPGCSVVGAKKCSGDAVVECGDANGDACLEWGAPVACAPGQTCSSGHCDAGCTDECTVNGAKQCDAGGVSACGQLDGDPCLEWGPPVPCDAPYVCDKGSCALTCTDECDVTNQKQCVAGTTGQFQVCGDHDADGCLEWGSAEDCAPGLVCSAGNCKATCESTCSFEGQQTCDADGTKTCGDTNQDGCLEWGTVTFCEPWEQCGANGCSPKPPPAKVVISELYYDSPGSDTDVFVELHGPAGTDLTGYSIVGVDGNDGSTYKPIPLGGAIGGDGLYLVANLDMAGVDLVTPNADYQNGPDSVQLLYGSTVVDALGYGASTFFAGEKNPAPDAPSGKSLARDSDYTDTDDNAADFTVVDPTPGAPNVPANQPPVAVLACPAGGEVGETLTFDGSASSDDGTITGYAFGFGDGTAGISGPGDTATHTYTAAGSWTVTLTVTDDQGQKGTTTCPVSISPAQPLDQKPTASFVATATGGLTVTVDATASADVETPPAELLVRWDFDNDGTWETDWSTDRIAEHTYASTGAHTIRLGVQDSAGQVDTALQTVTLATAKYVSGLLSTTTWSGTIIVTNDVEVAEGATLTVAAGTQVLVMYIDSGNGEGDVGIRVLGKIDVQGTAGSPVLFTVYQVANKVPRAWTGLEIRGTGSTVDHATFEYAKKGITLAEAQGVSVSNTTVRFCQIGIEHNWVGSSNLTNVTSTQNQEAGLYAYGSYKGDVNVSAVACTFSHNGTRGASIDSSANLTLAESTISDNGTVGLYGHEATLAILNSTIRDNVESGVYLEGQVGSTQATIQMSTIEGNDIGITYDGKTGGPVTATVITGNRREGVRLVTKYNGSKTYEPAPTIHGSNLFGNATEKGAAVAAAGMVYTSKGLGSGWHESAPWDVPGGHAAEWIRVQYDQTGAGYGSVQNAAEDKLISQFMADYWMRFLYVGDKPASSLLVGTFVYSASSWGVMELPTVIYYAPGAPTELLSVTEAGTVDCTGNYWGVDGADAAGAMAVGRDGAIDAAGAKDAPIAGAGAP